MKKAETDQKYEETNQQNKIFKVFEKSGNESKIWGNGSKIWGNRCGNFLQPKMCDAINWQT